MICEEIQIFIGRCILTILMPSWKIITKTDAFNEWHKSKNYVNSFNPFTVRGIIADFEKGEKWQQNCGS